MRNVLAQVARVEQPHGQRRYQHYLRPARRRGTSPAQLERIVGTLFDLSSPYVPIMLTGSR